MHLFISCVGFVSEHVALLYNQSRLYHYLAVFEPDLKRRLAMETKRTDILLPLLSALSRTAYEGLHKQV